MTNQEIIEVVQAHESGATIEERTIGSSAIWKEISHPNWKFDLSEYRAKKTPKVLWQWVIKLSSGAIMMGNFFASEADMRKNTGPGITVIQRADWTRIEINE